MRSEMRKVLGDDGYELFFERLLSAFYADADAAFLAESGLNCVRIPVNYRHLESDARPFEIIEDGFRHLDRAIAAGGEHGVYTLIDLHALPGSQNQHWHSDNPTHRALFWEHRHFQDRVVGIWEAIADRYKGNPWVVGYNLMNEPADESRAVVGPFYERLSSGDPRDRPGAHPLLRRQHLLDRVRLLRRAAGERRLHAARLRARRARARRRVPRARVGGGEVPRALGVRAPHGHADLRRRVLPDLHGRRGGRRRAPPDPRRPARDLQALRRRLRHVDVQGPRPPGADLRAGPTRPTARWSRTSSPRSGGSASTSGAAPAARTPRSPSRSRISSSARRRTSTPTRGAGSTSSGRWCSTSRSPSRWPASTPSSSAGSARTS